MPAAWICMRKGEHIHDSLAPSLELVRRPGRLPARPASSSGSCCRLDWHLGDAGELAPGDLVAKLFERIERTEIEPDRPVRCRGFLENVIERFQLFPQPSLDPRAAVVRLVFELPGELMLGFLFEQLDVGPSVEELGVGVRHEGKRAVRRSRAPVAVRGRLAANRLRQIVDGLVDHGVPEGVAAACAWS